MKAKHFTRITLWIAALMLLGGTMAASAASLNFGSIEVGDSAWTTVTFFWPTSSESARIRLSMPRGFLYGNYTGTVFPGSWYSVTVHVDSQVAGTYSGYMSIDLEQTAFPWSNLHTEYVYMTVRITEPCDPLSVSITGPTQGSTKSPNAQGNVILSASASQSANLVEFFVDGAKVHHDTTVAYAFAWPARDGSHQLYAKASDACGNSKVSSTVSFSVNCGNPSVTLTKPVNGSTVNKNAAGNVILEATASHSTGIAKVNFFVDGTLVRTDTSAPYAWAWPATSGSHLARARAFSKCGGSGVTSNAANFTVN